MKSLVSIFFINLIILNYVQSQCVPPSTDNCEDANVLCSLSEVNGYSCQNPDYSNPTGCSPLCPTGGGAHNTSWWAFVTSGGNVCITLTFSNCTVNNTGVQFGIWGDCSCGESVFCDPYCLGPGTRQACGNLTACKTYYLFVDGCTGDVCDFTLNTDGGGDPPSLPSLGNLTGPINLCKGACNVKYKIDLVSGSGCEPAWQWTLEGKEQDEFSNELILDFIDEGDFVLCATAIIGNPISGSICDQEGPKCVTIKVRQEKDRRDGPRHICFEKSPFRWHGQTISSSGEYTTHFTNKNCCMYDSVVTFHIRERPEPPTVYFLGCIGDQYKDSATGNVFVNCQNGTEIFLSKSTIPYKCDSAYNLVAAFINGTGRMREYLQNGRLYCEVTPIDRTCFDGGYLTEQFVFKWYKKRQPNIKIGEGEYIIINTNDQYCVDIAFSGRLEKLNKSCVFTVCENFNEDELIPTKLNIDGKQEFCTSDDITSAIYTINPGKPLGLPIQWTIVNGIFLSPSNLETVKVKWDIANSIDGEICIDYLHPMISFKDCKTIVFNKAYAGPDDAIQGFNYKLKAAKGNNGNWTQMTGPSLIKFENLNDAHSKIKVSKHGPYILRWTSQCKDQQAISDEVLIHFKKVKSKIPNKNNPDTCCRDTVGVAINGRIVSTQLEIYPNPVNQNKLFVKNAIEGLLFIEIIDSYGKVHYKNRQLIHGDLIELEIPENLVSGIYFVRLQNIESKIETKKILVSKYPK